MREAKEARNNEIRKRVANGESPTDLALEFGISRQRVGHICRPETVLANKAVGKALKGGRLSAASKCQSCGSDTILEAHHPEYDRRLDVVWLCRPCHAQADSQRRAEAGERRKSVSGPGWRARKRRWEDVASANARRRAERRKDAEQARADRDADMLQHFARLAVELGHTPRAVDINDLSPYWALDYRRRFGSLGGAALRVGLTPNLRGVKRAQPIPAGFAGHVRERVLAAA